MKEKKERPCRAICRKIKDVYKKPQRRRRKIRARQIAKEEEEEKRSNMVLVIKCIINLGEGVSNCIRLLIIAHCREKDDEISERLIVFKCELRVLQSICTSDMKLKEIIHNEIVSTIVKNPLLKSTP